MVVANERGASLLPWLATRSNERALVIGSEEAKVQALQDSGKALSAVRRQAMSLSDWEQVDDHFVLSLAWLIIAMVSTRTSE